MTRLESGALVVAVVAGAALLTGGVASAAPPAGSLGSLTITPATGSDLTVPTVRTSGPCPTDAFDLPFRVSLKDAPKGKALQAGEYEYHLTAQCVNGLTQEVFGTFTGTMFFTSPNAYQTTDPNVDPTVTTTALDVTPASPVAAGTVKTLTATVSLSEAAGSVQFKAGDNNIGRPVAVSGGTASTKTRLAVGTHPLTAVFTPTDANAFSGSTSNTVSYVVNVPTGAKAATTTPR